MIRDGRFDVVIAAGPRADPWPTVGVRALSSLCADMGLSVGVFGGESISVKGVIPLPGAGALVLAQDVQGRIHRIHARSVVRVSAAAELPDPFHGWFHQGLLPLSTARRFLATQSVQWDPGVAILGTGNSALRFGSQLLEKGVSEVFCLEAHAQWHAKRFSGWEVEKRRFEMAGGKIIEGVPLSLTVKSPLLWEFRLRDAQGVQVREVSHVVSAGPYLDTAAIREYPPGSLLFELLQSAGREKEDFVDGWMLEEERGRWLGCKIAKAIGLDQEGKKEELEKIQKRTKARLKRYLRHFEEPFTPGYQGKWMIPADLRRIKEFHGVPQKEHLKRPVASIECIESICCDICQVVCPEKAIESDRKLIEERCSGCGLCVKVCPSAAISVIQQRDTHPNSYLTIQWKGEREWKPGQLATLLNRRGESLGSGRVMPTDEGAQFLKDQQLVRLEVPGHLLWETRSVRSIKTPSAEDEAYLASLSPPHGPAENVDVMINGEKRRARDGVSISMALFELGLARPGDVLHCSDGSCGLCEVQVDGVKKLGCKTEIHRGMFLQIEEARQMSRQVPADSLCPCQGISTQEVKDRLKQGRLKSPEAVLSVTHLGEGKCRGGRCMDSFKRLLMEEGLDLTQWIDWRFPWSEWTPGRN